MGKLNIIKDVQIVVLMGGLGTRLGLLDCPKALADVNGTPFFDYQMKLLKRWGFHKFLFLVGYKAEQIEDYYGNGAKQGIEIQYSYDGKEKLGTGGALKKAKRLLENQFLLIYGDSFMDIDYQELIYRYYSVAKLGMEGIMTIFCNENRFDKSNVIYERGKILLYDKTNSSNQMRYIDYGVSMISKKAIDNIDVNGEFDFAEILKDLSLRGKLAAQEVVKRFYEIGNQISLNLFRQYAKERFGISKKAVFFDRDGVINKLTFNEEIEQLDSPLVSKDFEYVDGIIDSMIEIQKMGYYLFIVTNQPAAAKGKISLEKLYDLNTWLVKDLERKGVFVECINICPHHPIGSQKAENQFLIQECECRKPKSALITDLFQIYNLDLPNSYMIGDSYTDIIAGANAGIRTILLGELKCDMCKKMKDKRPDIIIQDISELKKVLKKG